VFGWESVHLSCSGVYNAWSHAIGVCHLIETPLELVKYTGLAAVTASAHRQQVSHRDNAKQCRVCAEGKV